MASRKKSSRRNTGGRRTVVQPPFYFGPTVAELDRGVETTRLAMAVAHRFLGR